MAKLIAVFKVTAPDPNYVDDRPLYKVAKRLAKGPPAYMRCAALQFPAWTKKKEAQRWTVADSNMRGIPGQSQSESMASYIAAFERMNNLLPTIAAAEELQEAA